MPAADFNMNEIHWLMDMFNTVDVGLVVLDRDYKVCIWNGFMENHSGMLPSAVKDKDLFDLFPSIDEKWFRSKSESVFILKNRSFTIWEQQPYIFRFKNYRPITGKADHMFQNATFIPLSNTMGEVGHICIILYDVTDMAVNKKELEEVNRELEQVSQTDALTKLTNRGHWEDTLRKEFLRIKRSGGTSTLLMFDIDHFKKVNDEHGHRCGDEALRNIADLLRKTLRETDIAGRYGGEEFVVLCPRDEPEDVVEQVRRVSARIKNAGIQSGNDSMHDVVTISAGVAWTNPNEGGNQDDLFERADALLYKAKSAGRNQVLTD